MKKFKYTILLTAGLLFGCEDSLVTTPYLFIDDNIAITSAADAEQVLLASYSALQVANAFGNLAVAVPGVLSDELVHTGSFPTIRQLDVNDVIPDNVTLEGEWQAFYHGIYLTNVLMERIELIKIDATVKAIIIGQARYLRAFMHFELTKLYGDIPLATVSDLKTLSTIKRTPQADIFAFIISELTASATALTGVDYGAVGRDAEDRTRAGEWAAKALLARAQLYSGNKAAAGTTANNVITAGGYTLPASYTTVFNGNSTETIFEIFASANDQNGLAFQFKSTGRYEYAPSTQLYNAMAVGDARLANIINYPAKPEATKYKDSATGTDKPIVSRLAEMYLIRAEANLGVNQTQVDADVNVIRARAGATPKAGVSLDDILIERFIELAFEGHRWNDLIRTSKVSGVMSVINPASWSLNDQLMPIPQYDIRQNPNILPQNPGY